MGEAERSQARDGRDGQDEAGVLRGRREAEPREGPGVTGGRDGLDEAAARRAAVLGRHIAPRAQAEHDVGRERVAPNDPDRDRREAILGRHRETGQEGHAGGIERDVAARSVEARDQGRRDDILGRGRDGAPERGQGRDRGRER